MSSSSSLASAVQSARHVVQAHEERWPHFLDQRTRIGAECGWPPPTRAQFEREVGPGGALFVGSPESDGFSSDGYGFGFDNVDQPLGA